MPEQNVLPGLVEIVQELGYRAVVKDDDIIQTAMSGYQVLIFIYDGSLQFYFGIVLGDVAISLEDVNRLNAESRFAKHYLDESGMSLEMDVFFNLTKKSAKNELDVFFTTFERCIALVDKAFLEASEGR